MARLTLVQPAALAVGAAHVNSPCARPPTAPGRARSLTSAARPVCIAVWDRLLVENPDFTQQYAASLLQRVRGGRLSLSSWPYNSGAVFFPHVWGFSPSTGPFRSRRRLRRVWAALFDSYVRLQGATVSICSGATNATPTRPVRRVAPYLACLVIRVMRPGGARAWLWNKLVYFAPLISEVLYRRWYRCFLATARHHLGH